jgi:hypothetical protein
MQQQINKLSEQIAEIEKHQINQSKDITIIKHAITGSDLNPNGVIERLDKLESFASKAKKHGYIVAGILIAFSALKAGWDNIIDWITHIV